MSEQLRFLSAYCDDPGLRRGLMALLATVRDLDLSDFDRLGFWDSEYRPYSFAEGDVMMVRGAFDIGDRPAMFPPTVLR